MAPAVLCASACRTTMKRFPVLLSSAILASLRVRLCRGTVTGERAAGRWLTIFPRYTFSLLHLVAKRCPRGPGLCSRELGLACDTAYGLPQNTRSTPRDIMSRIKSALNIPQISPTHTQALPKSPLDTIKQCFKHQKDSPGHHETPCTHQVPGVEVPVPPSPPTPQ